jgi:hypothetical protein
LKPSTNPRISIADQGYPGPVTLMDTMATLIRLAAAGDRDSLKRILMTVAQREWTPDEFVDLESPAPSQDSHTLDLASREAV